MVSDESGIEGEMNTKPSMRQLAKASLFDHDFQAMLDRDGGNEDRPEDMSFMSDQAVGVTAAVYYGYLLGKYGAHEWYKGRVWP